MELQSFNDILKKIIEKIINVLNSETVRTIGCEALDLVNPVAGTLANMANELLSHYNTIKFAYLKKGLSSGLNMEKQLNELYSYVNSSSENAMTVADLFRKTINAQSLKVCVIYGLILKDHIDKNTDLTQEELIVCKALENATDYDLKNFKKIMEKHLESTQEEGKIRVLIDDLPDKEDFTITCDWCVYNRLFVNQTGEIGVVNGEGILDLRNCYYTTNPARLLKRYIDEASSVWEYGEA